VKGSDKTIRIRKEEGNGHTNNRKKSKERAETNEKAQIKGFRKLKEDTVTELMF